MKIKNIALALLTGFAAHGDGSVTEESELKLGWPTGLSAERLRILPESLQELVVVHWQQKQLQNSYYDTEVFDLASCDYNLRIRSSGQSYELTLKNKGWRDSEGVLHRSEKVLPLNYPKLTHESLSDIFSDTGELLALQPNPHLYREIFSTTYTRWKALIKIPVLPGQQEGWLIEICIDEGEVLSALKGAMPIEEVELEIKQVPDYIPDTGIKKPLEWIRQKLEDKFGRMATLNHSKPDRGYALLKNRLSRHQPELLGYMRLLDRLEPPVGSYIN